MIDGGSVIAMTFHASSRVYPGYNVMGTAKAALEHEVRQLAHEYGGDGIRVNAISAGPIDTLAGPRDQRIPGHETRPRRAGAVAAEHHRGRGGENGAIPVQRLIDGRYRNGIAGWTPATTSWRFSRRL